MPRIAGFLRFNQDSIETPSLHHIEHVPSEKRTRDLQRGPQGCVLRLSCAHRIFIPKTIALEGFPEPGKTVKYDDSETIDPDTVALNGGFLLKILCLSNDPYLRGKMRDASVKSYSVSQSDRARGQLYAGLTATDGLTVFSLHLKSGNREQDNRHGVYSFTHIPPGWPTMASASSCAQRTPTSKSVTTYTAYIVRLPLLPRSPKDRTIISHWTAFQEYVIKEDAKAFKVLKNEEKLPWSVYVGTCGMPGKFRSLIMFLTERAAPGKTAYMGWKAFSKAQKARRWPLNFLPGLSMAITG